jgi:hypothetical protein
VLVFLNIVEHVFSCVVAYAFAQMRAPGKNVLFIIRPEQHMGVLAAALPGGLGDQPDGLRDNPACRFLLHRILDYLRR